MARLIVSSLLLVAAAREPRHGQVLKVESKPEVVASLQEMLDLGTSMACCGNWRNEAAAGMQQAVATQLGVQERRLSDVHISNMTQQVHASDRGEQGLWGSVAVLYLDSVPDVSVALSDGRQMQAPRGTMLILPEGAWLASTVPRRVAWLWVRRDEASARGFFDWYIASGIWQRFVVPKDTARERQFFSAHTQSPMLWLLPGPMLWHGFLWSFIGLSCTSLAMLPLIWRSIHFAEDMWHAHFGVSQPLPLGGHAPAKAPPISPKLPSLLRSSAEKPGLSLADLLDQASGDGASRPHTPFSKSPKV